MVADDLAKEEGCSWKKERVGALTCEIQVEAHRVILVKPQTYMNRSGQVLAPLLKRYNTKPGRMIVIHDDLDLPLGRIRIKSGGGDGGHKGVRSIADCLRFRDFIRVRIGIGRPPDSIEPEHFVLSPFKPEERSLVTHTVARGCRAVKLLIASGMEEARRVIYSELIESGQAVEQS
jgi:PTH1 family peptidyl-tRNA hydrolase